MLETLRACAAPALLGSFHAHYTIGRDNGYFASWLVDLTHDERVWALAYMAAIHGDVGRARAYMASATNAVFQRKGN